jgi:hypothetical protein
MRNGVHNRKGLARRQLRNKRSKSINQSTKHSKKINHNQRNNPKITHNQPNNPKIAHNQPNNPKINHNQPNNPKINQSPPITAVRQRGGHTITQREGFRPRSTDNRKALSNLSINQPLMLNAVRLTDPGVPKTYGSGKLASINTSLSVVTNSNRRDGVHHRKEYFQRQRGINTGINEKISAQVDF